MSRAAHSRKLRIFRCKNPDKKGGDKKPTGKGGSRGGDDKRKTKKNAELRLGKKSSNNPTKNKKTKEQKTNVKKRKFIKAVKRAQNGMGSANKKKQGRVLRSD